MKILHFDPDHFDPDHARTITEFGSHHATYSRLAIAASDAQVGIMHIAPGGVVGYHQTSEDQLFLVVQGSGWVTGADRQRREITAGQMAFWREGEWHESGSENGMTAVIIETDRLESKA